MDTVSESKSLFEADKKLAFFALCLATFLLLFIKKTFVEGQTAAFEFLADRPEGGFLQIVATLQYLSIPIIYLWKFTVIAFVIWMGSFSFGYRVTYSQCWGIALTAEFIFLIPEMLKILWFMFIQTDPDFFDIRAFYPLSLMHFFDYQQIETKYAYPLKALNLFEIFYWSTLAFGLQSYIRKKWNIAFAVVMSSYTILFFGWLVFYVLVYR